MNLTVALISEVFPKAANITHLRDALKLARSMGAELAALPELPLNRCAPATKTLDASDAEAPGGQRHQTLSNAARDVGIGLVGGAIVRDPKSGRRHNTAVVFGRTGTLAESYRKLYLPEEEGFWETCHYDPGDDLPSVIEAFPLRLGLQICSDINRPEGARLLAALGAEVIIVPRATEASTFGRWKTVFIATAMTSCAYVLSVARPRPEFDVPLGGPSIAIAPTGEVLVETTEPLAVVTMHRGCVEEARTRYPGYSATRADLLAEGWKRVGSSRLPHQHGKK